MPHSHRRGKRLPERKRKLKIKTTPSQRKYKHAICHPKGIQERIEKKWEHLKKAKDLTRRDITTWLWEKIHPFLVPPPRPRWMNRLKCLRRKKPVVYAEETKSLTTQELLDEFGSSVTHGLTSGQASNLASKYGKNALPERLVNPIFRFLGFMWNPFAWAMEFACLLSVILADYVDAALVMLLLLFNAVIGYWEERNAGNAVAALKKQLSPESLVLRDGKWQDLPSAKLVPGDILQMRIGDMVPADLKVIEGANIQIDQSSLTGESLAVSKAAGDCVYSGSVVKKGDFVAIAYATGKRTFFGKAASLVQNSNAEGNLQKVMKRIGFFCIGLITIGVIIEIIVDFAIRDPDCSSIWPEGACPSLSNTLVLIVGGVPVAMPTVLSVTLAIGASRLAKRDAIITRLSAVEELAGMDVLCSDKTGTLTLNHLTVHEPVGVPGYDDTSRLVFLGALCSVHESLAEDAIDRAMHEALFPEQLKDIDLYEVLRFVPFDPTIKRTEASLKMKDSSDGGVFHVSKGAPQVILGLSSNRQIVTEWAEQTILDFAQRGLRALGVMESVTEEELVFMFEEAGVNPPDPLPFHKDEETQEKVYWAMRGLIPLYDPPRHDTKETLEWAKELGISVKMLTGDQLAIAKETSLELGLGDNIQLSSALTDGELGSADIVESADGFAEVFPEHKHAIVKALRARHHIVGMTGDGVNDAPALKVADIGIAVADATDAARGASDIVLVTPGLSVVIDAIIGARKIFQRMRNYSTYSVTTTVRFVMTFVLLTVIDQFYFPTLLVVVIAVLNDGTILTISKDRAQPNRSPDKWNLLEIFGTAIILGAWLSLSTVVFYLLLTDSGFFTNTLGMEDLSGNQVRAAIYLQVSISGQAAIFVTRSHTLSFLERPSPLLMYAFIVAQFIATVIAIFGFGGYPNDDIGMSGCGLYYAMWVWIWCIITYPALDVLHWITSHIIVWIYKPVHKKIEPYTKGFHHLVHMPQLDGVKYKQLPKCTFVHHNTGRNAIQIEFPLPGNFNVTTDHDVEEGLTQENTSD